MIFGRDGITAEDKALQERMEGGDLVVDEGEEADLQEEDFRSRKLTDEEKIALRIRVNDEKHDALEKTFGCPVKILSELIAEREEQEEEENSQTAEASAQTTNREEPKQQPAPKPAPKQEEPKEDEPKEDEPKEEKPSEPVLKAAPGNVTWTAVGSNFPGSVDVRNSSTYQCSNVNRYFDEKYSAYKGTFVLSHTVTYEPYESGGNLNHQRKINYTLKRTDDNKVIAKEYYGQVLEKTSLSTPASSKLTAEYNKIVVEAALRKSIEKQVVDLINQARREAGLFDLVVANDLTYLARVKSIDMGITGNFSHQSDAYGSPFEMAASLDVSLRAENIQWASFDLTAERIHNNFMDSSGHRANRMRDSYRYVGIGIARTENGFYVTEHFR